MKNVYEWRKKLKAGDLVMMKHGGMAILTEVLFQFASDEPLDYPHIKMVYCNDATSDSCSSWRVKEVLCATR